MDLMRKKYLLIGNGLNRTVKEIAWIDLLDKIADKLQGTIIHNVSFPLQFEALMNEYHRNNTDGTDLYDNNKKKSSLYLQNRKHELLNSMNVEVKPYSLEKYGKDYKNAYKEIIKDIEKRTR